MSSQMIKGLTEDAIRSLAGARSFSRGQDYYREGLVLSLVQRGDEIHARVAGSGEEPYRVASHVTCWRRTKPPGASCRAMRDHSGTGSATNPAMKSQT